jgi:uncharacterized protein
MRYAGRLALILGLLGAASAQGQRSACSPAAVTTDPDPVDTAYPPSMQVLQLPSGGVRINGVFYLAQGRRRHPTVVFLHGFPGDEKNLDLAQAVRRAGFNALVFYYRGAWGSPGTYSYSHVLEDVGAVLAWLRDPAIADSMRVDSRRLVLVGHSLGGFIALYTAATRSGIAAVAALAPIDLGRRGVAMRESGAFANREVKRRGSQLGALRGTSGEDLSREVMAHADQWSLQQYADVLAKQRILLLAANWDRAVDLSEVYLPLSAKLRAAGARDLTAMTFPSDHLFSSVRIGLARTLVQWLCGSR